jgi:hypothetical protein
MHNNVGKETRQRLKKEYVTKEKIGEAQARIRKVCIDLLQSTYVQVLIGLASGIIAALIGFYPTLLGIKYFNFLLLKVALGCFGFSIVGGLIGLVLVRIDG